MALAMLLLLPRFWFLGLLIPGQALCRQIRDVTHLESRNHQINVEPDEICLTYVTTYLVSVTDGSNLIPVTFTQSVRSGDTLDPGDISPTQPYIAPGSEGQGSDSTAPNPNFPDVTIPATQSEPAGGPSQLGPSQAGNSQGTASPIGSATTGGKFAIRYSRNHKR